MGNKSDYTIKVLTGKKAELLRKLLRLSQLFLLNGDNISSVNILDDRKILLQELQLNDQAIQMRELETGISALEQESSTTKEINEILNSIHENNFQSINYLNQEKGILESERLKMERSNKLTDYVAQQNGFNSGNNRVRQYHLLTPARKNEFRGQTYGQF